MTRVSGTRDRMIEAAARLFSLFDLQNLAEISSQRSPGLRCCSASWRSGRVPNLVKEIRAALSGQHLVPLDQVFNILT